jgi:hypothetical protein
MHTLQVKDEEVYRKLMENGGAMLDDVLRDLLRQEAQLKEKVRTPEALLRDYRRKVYAQARRYWQETVNTGRLALTDDELDEQFWQFDDEGVPRLKSDRGGFELVETAAMKLVRLVENADLLFDRPFSAADADDIIREEMGEHLWRQIRGSGEAEDSGG